VEEEEEEEGTWGCRRALRKRGIWLGMTGRCAAREVGLSVLGRMTEDWSDRAPTYNRSVLIASSSFKLWLVFRLLIPPLLSYPLLCRDPAPTLLL